MGRPDLTHSHYIITVLKLFSEAHTPTQISKRSVARYFLEKFVLFVFDNVLIRHGSVLVDSFSSAIFFSRYLKKLSKIVKLWPFFFLLKCLIQLDTGIQYSGLHDNKRRFS